MTVYTFEVKGKPIYSIDVEPAVYPDSQFELAMTEADKHFGSLPHGVWWPKGSWQDYYWVPGTVDRANCHPKRY